MTPTMGLAPLQHRVGAVRARRTPIPYVLSTPGPGLKSMHCRRGPEAPGQARTRGGRRRLEGGRRRCPVDDVVVERHREIGHALGGHIVHGLGDDPVLEHRLGEVDDVVGDDRSPASCEGPDVVGERGLPSSAVAKASDAPGAMSWTIWSIARPSSLLGGRRSRRAPATGAVRPQGFPPPGCPRWHVVRRVRCRAVRCVVGVREDSDLHTGAVDVELGSGDAGPELGVPLATRRRSRRY